ncbi:MAG: lamin tail domain-containing protein [Chloroflexota bacterium]
MFSSKKIIRILLISLLLMMLFSSTASAAKKVSIKNPSEGAEVSGLVTISGTGSGADTEVSIDGGAWQATSGGKDWSYDWDTTLETDESHTITVQYTDGSSSDSITVAVNNGGSSGPRAPVVGEVLINEFVAAAGSVETSEWIEIFNTTSESLTIGGMFIDDIDAGGGVPKEIPADTVIEANSYYVMSFDLFFNNTGDDARLLGTDSSTVFDAYTYSSATSDMSWCRKPDGDDWAVIECSPTQGTTNDPPLPPGTWTPGTLEIHVLNVGQGESQLIISPTGETLLIDVFEASWNTNAGATWVASEIRRITGSSHVDYIMASHWHLDHMGYAGYGGIWSLLEEQGITTDAIIDRDGGVWDDANQDNICDPDLEIVWHNAGTTSGTGRNWACWVTDPNTLGGQVRELAQLGSSTQIDLGIANGVTVKIVQVDADGVMMADGITPVQGDHTADSLPPSENDYSITVWINWGKFDFVSGGDTDGEYATSSYGYVYNDVESVVAGLIDQEVEAIWVNHHGSEHSTNQTYVDTLDPSVAIYGVGSTNSYGHPDQAVIDRLYNNGTKQYFTQIGDPDRDYYDSVIVDGNVVIQVTDSINYTVDGDAYEATDPSTGPADPRTPEIGEVVLNEFLAAPQTLFSVEWIELFNTTGDRLDIGGMWLDDLIGAGSSPQQIPAGTILEPGSYYVYELSSYLNNTGDDVHLLGTDGTTVHDSYTYSSSSYDLSICRTPDGGAWTIDCIATKGFTNN